MREQRWQSILGEPRPGMATLAGLRAAGWRTAHLWVLTGNDAAIAFYAAHGFAPDGAAKLEPVGPEGATQSVPHLRMRAEL